VSMPLKTASKEYLFF